MTRFCKLCALLFWPLMGVSFIVRLLGIDELERPVVALAGIGLGFRYGAGGVI